MAHRPTIGMTMRLEGGTRRFYLGRDYSEALEAAGAIPVHLPLIPKRDYIAEAMQDLDGILLPGSDSDVDPSYYGEDPHPGLGRVVPEKDETEFLVLAEAERLALPMLGICFGMQSLNVSRGGSLIQDINSQVENCIKHEQEVSSARSSHDVRIIENSLLASMAKNKKTVKVNTSHHQAIDRVGDNLIATAWANDNVIEAIEDTRKDRFVFGVQWHPELSWETDPLSRAIFRVFVGKCAKARTSGRAHRHANGLLKRLASL